MGRWRAAGFSLIEFMVAIAISTMLVLGVGAAFTSNVKISNETLESATLEQNVNVILDMMASELRRAGYWNSLVGTVPEPYPHIFVDNTGTCVLYFYDADDGGDADAGEMRGFRLNGSGVQYRDTCADASLTSCIAAAKCTSDDDWDAETLSDDELVDINALTITTTGSNCLNLAAGSATTADRILDYWEITGTGATSFSCPCTSDTDIQYYDYDAATATYSAGNCTSTNVPVNGDRIVGVRQINIDLDALAAEDEDGVLEKQVFTSVRLGNNLVCTLPNCP